MGITYTEDQNKVIQLHERNILVAAAAGSGKTAVLVERIIQMISDASGPVDIDRLLVVTFTSAAASEMRERISNAILQKIQEEPENGHLQKQATLIHNAQITTIHSFCLFLIRNHFNDIGLDPGFRIADEGELKLLEQDVLAELLEDRFAEREEAFLHLVETYCPGGNEKVLEEYILRLYNFSVSYPWPLEWLEQGKQSYLCESEEELYSQEWMKQMLLYVKQMLGDCEERLAEGMRICALPDGPYMYEALLEQEMQSIRHAADSEEWNTFYERITQITFGRLPVKKDESVSSACRELVKAIRGEVKDMVKKLNEQYFSVPPAQALADMQGSAPAISTLLDVTMEFAARISTKKREKNIIDFSDIEHFALDILLEKENGIDVPTKTAQGYQEYFEEILIDEYQDSNLVQEYLLKSISRESMGGEQKAYNRFMVGDVKQSIYKFRLARPEIFMEKYETYSSEDSRQQRIDLHQNFRSRREVLEHANYVCGQIMTRDVGGVEYDGQAALYQGAVYEEVKQEQAVELLMVDTSSAEAAADTKEAIAAEAVTKDAVIKETRNKEDRQAEKERSKRGKEAAVIAARIQEMAGRFMVTDRESGQLRPARYSDIVILLRSNTGWDEEFRKVLTEAGIPAHIASKTGYFSAWEVQLVLHFLRILDNPLQDIPLCGVLLSPLADYTEEELAVIRAGRKDGKLYDALTTYVKCEAAPSSDSASAQEEIVLEQTALQKKTTAFLTRIEHYRRKLPYTPIHELLQELFHSEGFLREISALPGGEQRRANLLMLLEKAITFEQTSYRGLFHFIRYMEQMEKYDVDFGEANMLDEHSDTVRIMTIHKSKGLEFPICFVAGLSKQFNMADARKSLIVDMDYGIAGDFVDYHLRTKTVTIRKKAIALKIKQDTLGEELRILYVALTRAKEKLILTGTAEQLDKKLASLLPLLVTREEKLPFSYLTGASSYLDYVLAAYIRHPVMQELMDSLHMEVPEDLRAESQKNQQTGHNLPELKICYIGQEQIGMEQLQQSIRREVLKRKLQDASGAIDFSSELQEELRETFSYVYPHGALAGMYTKTTVTELKKMGLEQANVPQEEFHFLYREEEIVPYIPRFIQEASPLTGAAAGSAYHKILELLTFGRAENEAAVVSMIQEFAAQKKIPAEYLTAVSAKYIMRFCESPAGIRMKKAEKLCKLYKEQPFVIGIAADKVRTEFPPEETVLIQGIIDVYWEEEDGLVVLDYKTDRVTEADELKRRYQVQLDYYAMALERLTGKTVKEKIIYSFALQELVQLEKNQHGISQMLML